MTLARWPLNRDLPGAEKAGKRLVAEDRPARPWRRVVHGPCYTRATEAYQRGVYAGSAVMLRTMRVCYEYGWMWPTGTGRVLCLFEPRPSSNEGTVNNAFHSRKGYPSDYRTQPQ